MGHTELKELLNKYFIAELLSAFIGLRWMLTLQVGGSTLRSFSQTPLARNPPHSSFSLHTASCRTMVPPLGNRHLQLSVNSLPPLVCHPLNCSSPGFTFLLCPPASSPPPPSLSWDAASFILFFFLQGLSGQVPRALHKASLASSRTFSRLQFHSWPW